MPHQHMLGTTIARRRATLTRQSAKGQPRRRVPPLSLRRLLQPPSPVITTVPKRATRTKQSAREQWRPPLQRQPRFPHLSLRQRATMIARRQETQTRPSVRAPQHQIPELRLRLLIHGGNVSQPRPALRRNRHPIRLPPRARRPTLIQPDPTAPRPYVTMVHTACRPTDQEPAHAMAA